VVHQPLELVVVVHARVRYRVERKIQLLVVDGGSATVAVPPLKRVPDELELLELQSAAINATTPSPAIAARRSLRLHRFMCAPSARACVHVIGPIPVMPGRPLPPDSSSHCPRILGQRHAGVSTTSKNFEVTIQRRPGHGVPLQNWTRVVSCGLAGSCG
jgi:hypothetical protein